MWRIGTLLCIGMACAFPAQAQFFSDYWGKPLSPAGQRPLLIASYENMRALYRDPAMSAPENRVGFVNRLAIDPENFDLKQLGLQNSPDELLSLQRTQLESSLLSSGEQLTGFDGRVIIWGHSSAAGRFASETLLDQYDGVTEMEMFGYRLGEFFQRTGIRPRQIDFMGCCGLKNAPRLMEGLNDAGVTDFLLRAVDGNVMHRTTRYGDTLQEWIVFRGEDEQDTELSEIVRASEFFSIGEMPDDQHLWMVEMASGEPHPIDDYCASGASATNVPATVGD